MKIKVYFSLLLAGILLLGACNRNKSDGLFKSEDLYLPDLNQLFENYESAERTGSYAAFANQLVKANRDLQSSELYVEAASLYDQAGHSDSVAILLHLAIDHGMANPNILERLKISPHQQGSTKWKELHSRLDSIRERLSSVDNFSLEVAAMSRFWPYFEKAKKDTSLAKAIFKEYIFSGPTELRDYYAVRYYSTEAMFGQMINAAPRYYSYLHKYFDPDRLDDFKDVTRKWMKNFQELYPQAVFPKVYVVPGILNSGGTATEMGLFIGGDMYGKSGDMPTQELTEWQKDAIMEASSLPTLTMHELMHFQQSYSDPKNTNTVLSGIIQEGVCDLLVELCSGEKMKNSNLAYLEDPGNREKIFSELKADLHGEDLSKWLYNGGSIQDRPHDLGYTMGYLITKSYYKKQADKKKAINELLNSRDLDAIIRQSDYAFLIDAPL